MAETSATAGPPAAEPLLDTIASLWREMPGLLSDRVELLSLELQRAGIALAQIVALVVVAAILGATAWLTLWCGITAALIALGLHWGVAVLAVLGINLLAAWAAVQRVRALVPRLRLPATLRHLTSNPGSDPAPVPAAAAAAEGR